jgi:hypothetical protein
VRRRAEAQQLIKGVSTGMMQRSGRPSPQPQIRPGLLAFARAAAQAKYSEVLNQMYNRYGQANA